MALITDYSDANKIEKYGRVVTYEAEPVVYSNRVLDPKIIYWKAKRTSRTRFEYVGMTRTAAEECRAAMVEKYTRSYMAWEAKTKEYDEDYPDVFINELHVVKCGAGIEPRLISGDNWGVDCNIDEQDDIIVLEEPKTKDDFDSIFQAAELRDSQDFGKSGIAIKSATWYRSLNQIQVFYNQEIANFDDTLLSVQVKNQQGAWEAAAGVERGYGTISFAATTNKTCRLNYNSLQYVSKAYTTTTPPYFLTVLSDLKFLLAKPSERLWNPTGAYARVDGILESEDVRKASETNAWGAEIDVNGHIMKASMSEFNEIGLDASTQRIRFYFKTRSFALPAFDTRPFTGVKVNVYPLGESRGVMANAFSVDEVDYIDALSETHSGSQVQIVFKTNLPQSGLSETVTGVVVGRDAMSEFEAPVTYTAQGNGQYLATFQNSWMGHVFGKAVIHGVNAGGDAVISQYVQIY